MNAQHLAKLGILDCAILRHVERDRFMLEYGDTPWLNTLLPLRPPTGEFTLGEQCAFLQDFLHDAIPLWQSGEASQLHSGIWTEQIDDQMLRLEAIAANTEGTPYLIIMNMQQQFERQQRTLQQARELLLSNDRIVAQHEYIHERLEQALTAQTSLQQQQTAVMAAIEQAEGAVMITDAQLNPVLQNQRAYRLFELDNQGSEQTAPTEVLLKLFRQQYPEYDRILATRSSWRGELYFHKPPHWNKWFRVAIHPVMDEHAGKLQWLILATDVTRLKHLLQHNEKLTLYDAVTHLPNRQSFWQYLQDVIGNKQRFYLIYIDIHHFKRINELHGHMTGDVMLKQVGERLMGALHEDDMLARVGGAEFAAILTDCPTRQQCQMRIQRLIDAMASPFYVDDEHKHSMTLNLGAASYPHDGVSAEDLMKFADLARHASKQSLKSQVEFYSQQLQETSRRRIQLEQALRDAIEQNQFELYLQPMLDLQGGQIVKAEALLRWHTKDGTLANPAEFIPIAEQSGLIVPIGKWVMSEACRILAKLDEQGFPIKLSINLSPRQITDRQLFDDLRARIDESGVDPTRLELELTEGVLVDNYETVQYLLTEFRNLGITVAIDDFGTGYSSLAYLKRLPIDSLKIDRSFVQDLDVNEHDKAIVLAVIAMAHSLKLRVIAEGVETEPQRAFLRDNQCDNAQGFLFSQPKPFDAFLSLLRSKKEP